MEKDISTEEDIEKADGLLASPTRRIIAFIIDALLIIGIIRLFFLSNYRPGIINFRALLILMSLFLYDALLTFFVGSTLGKIITAIKVVDKKTFDKPSLQQSLIRPFVKLFFGLAAVNNTLVSFLNALYFFINLVRMIGHDEHESIHDLVSGTVVIRYGK